MRKASSRLGCGERPALAEQKACESGGVIVEQSLGVDCLCESLDLDDEVILEQSRVAIVESVRVLVADSHDRRFGEGRDALVAASPFR